MCVTSICNQWLPATPFTHRNINSQIPAPCHQINFVLGFISTSLSCFDSKSHCPGWAQTQENKLHFKPAQLLHQPLPPWTNSSVLYYCYYPSYSFRRCVCMERVLYRDPLNLLLFPVTTKQWRNCLGWLSLTSTRIVLMGISLLSIA